MLNIFYAQFDTDKIIYEEYFPKDYIGTCIEVGAVDGVESSNTLFFERRGWECLCIEPQPGPGYFASLKKNRKNALNYAISSIDIDEIEFTVVHAKADWTGGFRPWNGMSGLSVDERLIKQHEAGGFELKREKILVEARRLDWCIEKHFNHPKIDFISIDTEGSELDVLHSFDVNKYNTRLLVIENNYNDPEVENYLKPFGWKKDRRVEINDFYVKV